VWGNGIGSFGRFGFGNMMPPAKRKRALLDSNPLRNNRRELIARSDERFTDFPSGLFLGPRNRFPDALKTQGWCGVARCGWRATAGARRGPNAVDGDRIIRNVQDLGALGDRRRLSASDKPKKLRRAERRQLRVPMVSPRSCSVWYRNPLTSVEKSIIDTWIRNKSGAKS
jgi:hypothetical protein